MVDARGPGPTTGHRTDAGTVGAPIPPEDPLSSQRLAPRSVQTFAEGADAIVANVASVVQGKDDAIRLALTCLLSEGHLLIEDVPGVGKTSLAKALAASLGCTWGRIQFTPDLLPSDVTGVSVYNRSAGTFEFRPGPVFHQILLADEINRASPKTQSALMEAMEERQVTVDGTTYQLPRPFMVIATQNPMDHEGTYPLPESQLDRFLMRISMEYPAREAEIAILDTHGAGSDPTALRRVASADDVALLIAMAQSVHVAPSLKGYIVDVAGATRARPELLLGASPRASLALLRASRVRAASLGREYVIPDDIKSLARPVLEHRLVLAPEAQHRRIDRVQLLDEAIAGVSVPSGR